MRHFYHSMLAWKDGAWRIVCVQFVDQRHNRGLVVNFSLWVQSLFRKTKIAYFWYHIVSKCEFLFNKLKTWWVREPFSQNWWIRPNPSNPCWRGPCTAKNALHGSITRHDWRLAWKVLTCLPVWKIFVLMQDPVWMFYVSSSRNLLFMCFFFSPSSCYLLKYRVY